jgi:hypothetical protein
MDEPAATEPLDHSTEDVDTPMPVADARRLQGTSQLTVVTQEQETSGEGGPRASDYLPRPYAPAAITNGASLSAEGDDPDVPLALSHSHASHAHTHAHAEASMASGPSRATPRGTMRDRMSQFLEPYTGHVHGPGQEGQEGQEAYGDEFEQVFDEEEPPFDEDDEGAGEEMAMAARVYHSGDSDMYEMEHRPILERTAVKRDIREFVASSDTVAANYHVVDRLGEGELGGAADGKDELTTRYLFIGVPRQRRAVQSVRQQHVGGQATDDECEKGREPARRHLCRAQAGAGNEQSGADRERANYSRGDQVGVGSL